MPNNTLTLTSLLACCELVKTEFNSAAIAALGCDQDAYDKLTQDNLWMANDRPIVLRAFGALRDGLCTYLGTPPISVPAEFIAAVILGLVSPVNYRVCCSWVGNFSSSSADLAQNIDAPVNANQLYSLLVEAMSNNPKIQSDMLGKVRKSLQKVKAL